MSERKIGTVENFGCYGVQYISILIFANVFDGEIIYTNLIDHVLTKYDATDDVMVVSFMTDIVDTDYKRLAQRLVDTYRDLYSIQKSISVYDEQDKLIDELVVDEFGDIV